MVRFHTLTVAFAITACGSGSSSKLPPAEPPNPVVALAVDAAIDPPAPPKLACDPDTSPVPAPAPEPTWYCARADGTRHGRFLTLHPDATIEISGSYENGALDGPWERRAATGTIIEQGGYVAGMKHGTWTQTSSTGAPLGQYEMTAGSGVEKRWYDAGPLYSETAFKAGVLDGPAKVYARDGKTLNSARYASGVLDGAHVFGTHNTLRFEETFTNGVRRGRRRIYHLGLLLADEHYAGGRLSGPYAQWRSTKVMRIKGQYSGGRRTGTWVWNDREGRKEREGSYAGGKRTGEWNEWFEEKIVFNGSYTNGRPDGRFTWWTRTGVEIGHFDIRDGTGWMMTLHGNGKPASRQYLYKGVENGAYQELTRANKLVVEGHYAGGIRHGVWKKWNADGVLLLEETFKKGKLDGVVKKYVDGKLSTQSTYVEGKAEGEYAEYRLDKPAVTGQFAADLETGTWTHRDAAGVVVRTATYKDGVLDGPWREQTGGVVLEGAMVAGRRSGTWTRTDKVGGVRKLTYRAP